MSDDTRVLAADGTVHLVPPLGQLAFCGREPVTSLPPDQPADRDDCPACAELAAARDHAQTRARAQ